MRRVTRAIPSGGEIALCGEPPQTLEGRRRLQREFWESWGASLLLHAALLLALGAFLLPAETDLPPVMLETRIGDESGAADEIDFAVFPVEAAVPVRDHTPPAVMSLLATGPAELPVSTPDISEGAETVATGQGSGGSGDAGGSGKGRGVKFFGTDAEGESFVFLVDCSGSMRGRRFQRARAELFKTLLHLSESQRFFVIFYNHSAIPMHLPGQAEGTLAPASRQVLRLARRWIKDRSPAGGTVPDEALRLALELKPDVIFLLSDGKFARTARTTAAQYNTNGTVIHTIAFEYRGGEAILQGIAQDHQGRYRFVP